LLYLPKENFMAKAASPIRLQDNIMRAAALAGKRDHRSTAEQIEYWADMGRKVATFLNPNDLLSVSSGLSKIRVEPVYSESVSPVEVFQMLEDHRASGILPQIVTGSPVKYQVSLAHPGCLEQIGENGEIAIGKFENGEFIALVVAKS
jgi:hypothetical protein